VHHRYELPGFSTLVRIAQQSRDAVNDGYFDDIARQLSPAARKLIDELLKVPASATHSGWQALKREPKKPTNKEVREYLQHIRYLRHLVDQLPAVKVTVPKLRHFHEMAHTDRPLHQEHQPAPGRVAEPEICDRGFAGQGNRQGGQRLQQVRTTRLLGPRQERVCRRGEVERDEQNLLSEYHIRYGGYGPYQSTFMANVGLLVGLSSPTFMNLVASPLPCSSPNFSVGFCRSSQSRPCKPEFTI